jgi:hypothetical protein
MEFTDSSRFIEEVLPQAADKALTSESAEVNPASFSLPPPSTASSSSS